MADEMTRQEFSNYMEAFEQRLDKRFQRIDSRSEQVDTRLEQIDTRLEDLKQSMSVQFEDVRRDIRFSLEAVQGVREVTDRGFEDRQTQHREQISLLRDVLHHVRGRVERLEPPQKKRS